MPTTISGTDGVSAVVDGTIVAADIASGAVTTAKVADANITAAKLDGAQTGSAPIYGCRAWVNFNGTAGTTVDGEFRCTIRGSGNVTKAVRTGTGDYTVTFTTAMPNANYAAVIVADRGGSANMRNAQTATQLAGSVSFVTNQQGVNTGENMEHIRVAIFA